MQLIELTSKCVFTFHKMSEFLEFSFKLLANISAFNRKCLAGVINIIAFYFSFSCKMRCILVWKPLCNLPDV